jgi:hypothetical protein
MGNWQGDEPATGPQPGYLIVGIGEFREFRDQTELVLSWSFVDGPFLKVGDNGTDGSTPQELPASGGKPGHTSFGYQMTI